MERNREIKIRLSEKELRELNKKVSKTSMSREGYCRLVINGKTPVEIPPAPYFDLIREVRMLGNSMNQIAYKANALGFIDAPYYRKSADAVITLADKLMTVCLPRAETAAGNE